MSFDRRLTVNSRLDRLFDLKENQKTVLYISVSRLYCNYILNYLNATGEPFMDQGDSMHFPLVNKWPSYSI